MSIFSENMRYLRGQLQTSQQNVADSLKITRGRYVKYEDGSNEPPIDILIMISKFYKISIDFLLTVDLKKYPIDQMLKLADNRIVLPITVDSRGENKIEIIPQKASMGYLSGYSDPGYIESLQSISLPFLRNGKYRAFPTEGDSMPPYNDGTYVVGKYVENIDDLKKGKTYIFITRNEGITYKRFQEMSAATMTVTPDNDFYEPYTIKKSQLLEIWEYACSINTEELGGSPLDMNAIRDMLMGLKKEIKELKMNNSQ
ncbi:XRE family transcriptional regulator [Chryseobacterium sp.]|uniref:XRE family transcriptional regulator n=1 Tax=Chryseobacterium sp. TaxID=1871047 RepID=UPI0011CB2955|nr:helix-turn-helix domain-containing protein [Chryseobacterium sp.]TXF79262.1 helix-turn-helix domain-containing protein [Chryseobacterium sp.]